MTTLPSRWSSSDRAPLGSSSPPSSRASEQRSQSSKRCLAWFQSEDEDVSKELLRLFKKRGIDVHLGAKVDKIEKNKDGVLVHFTKSDGTGETKQAEKVLVAVGRAPRTYDVGLDKVKITPDRGFIVTNEWMETTEPGIYAIGDIVAGLPQLAHVGSMAGLVVAARIAGKFAKPVNRTRIPGCTYCDPQIASVGLTEAQAKEKGFQVKVGKFPFVGNSKATILDAHDGFVKVVSDAKHGEILGVHIIGPTRQRSSPKPLPQLSSRRQSKR